MDMEDYEKALRSQTNALGSKADGIVAAPKPSLENAKHRLQELEGILTKEVCAIGAFADRLGAPYRNLPNAAAGRDESDQPAPTQIIPEIEMLLNTIQDRLSRLSDLRSRLEGVA